MRMGIHSLWSLLLALAFLTSAIFAADSQVIPISYDGGVGICTPRATRCSDSLTVQQCQNGQWVEFADCAPNTSVCQNGACVALPIPIPRVCDEGARRCSDSMHAQVCLDNAWRLTAVCSSDYTCQSGSCVKNPVVIPINPSCDSTRLSVSPDGQSHLVVYLYDAQTGAQIQNPAVQIYSSRNVWVDGTGPNTADHGAKLNANSNVLYDLLVADQFTYNYVFAARQASVPAGKDLRMSICLTKLENIPSPTFSGSYDTVHYDVGVYPETGLNQNVIRVTSSVPGAFKFSIGRSSEFYYLPSGGYMVRQTGALVRDYSTGPRIEYLQDTGYQPSFLYSTYRLFFPDYNNGAPVAQFIIDTDYSRLYCSECAGRGDLLWAQTFGWPDVRSGQPANKVSSGFTSPSGLTYTRRSEGSITFRVPLYNGGSVKKEITPLLTNRPIRGNPDAPITIVEFADYQCPYCQAAEPTVQQIMYNYNGKVKLYYLQYPLSFHPDAQKAAEASECASDQGYFWPYHDRLFSTRQLDGWSLKQHAASLGLNTEMFSQCLDSGQMASRVRAQAQAGADAGVSGTPTFFINDQLVVGAQPYSTFASVIEAELRKSVRGGVPAPVASMVAKTYSATASTSSPTPASLPNPIPTPTSGPQVAPNRLPTSSIPVPPSVTPSVYPDPKIVPSPRTPSTPSTPSPPVPSPPSSGPKVAPNRLVIGNNTTGALPGTAAGRPPSYPSSSQPADEGVVLGFLRSLVKLFGLSS